MEFANKENPHDLVLSALCSADLMSLLRQYDQAETLAARALELAEKHQFSTEIGYSLCTLRGGASAATAGRRYYCTYPPKYS